MSQESGNRAAFDPTEVWRQWYEAGSKMWSNMLGSAGENYLDPYGLYRQWFSGLENLQKQMFGSAGRLPAATGTNNPASLVNPDAAQNPAAAANPVADAAKGQVVEAQNLWKQWFDAVNESWQKAGALGNAAIDLAPRWVAMLDQI
ncbi:MAG: hypothetical protein M3262_06105, partial [Actinomycetota bacterium]|nr:hypothetical protein [Actinomycetota bacterium]